MAMQEVQEQPLQQQNGAGGEDRLERAGVLEQTTEEESRRGAEIDKALAEPDCNYPG